MKKQFIIFLLLISGISFPAFGETPALTGTWNIDNTVIKKTKDGILSTQSYDANQKPDCYALCPNKLIFSGEEVTLVFRNNAQTKGNYEVQGDLLIVKTLAVNLKYKLEMQGNILHLTGEINYLISGLNKVKEECHFYGIKE